MPLHLLDHKIPPPVVGALVVAGMWLASPVGPPLPIDATLRHAISGLCVVIGLGFDLSGVLAFRAARTTLNPLRPARASTLVVGGVYAITRNPMYVGLLFLLLGWAVYLSAAPAFAGPIVYMLYVTRFQIVPEERILEEVFGEAYRQYAERVRRWL